MNLFTHSPLFVYRFNSINYIPLPNVNNKTKAGLEVRFFIFIFTVHVTIRYDKNLTYIYLVEPGGVFPLRQPRRTKACLSALAGVWNFVSALVLT